MKATHAQKIKTGIFTLIGLVLLVGAVFLIGRAKNMFGNNFHVYAMFKNVGGLQIGNNVRFVGINVGTVTDITIVSDTLAKVTMVIDEKTHPYIKSDAVASIGSDGLMGDKLVAISSASANTVIIKEGATITTVNPTDFGQIMNKISNIATNAEVITDGLAGIATQISHGKGNIGHLIYDDNLSKNLDASVTNMKSGTAGFSENMTALKHNFLLKGYFKKKARKKEEAAEQAQEDAAKAAAPPKETRAEKRAERKAAKKEKKEEKHSSGQ